MKKSIISKSVLAFLLVAALTLSTVATTYAQVKISKLDQELIEKGYPQLLIARSSEEEKLKFKNGTFLGASSQFYTESGETYKVDYSPNSVAPAPRGGIKDTTFELLISAMRNSDGNIEVNMRYEWFRMPLNRHEDLVSFSWDGNKFLVDSHTFDSVDFYSTKKEQDIIKNTSNNFASLSFHGGSYYAGLKGGLGVTSLWGAANFMLYPNTSSGTSAVFVKYCHRKTLVKLTASIPNFGTISVDQGASNYDERATNFVFEW